MTFERRFAIDPVRIRVLPDGRVSREEAAIYLGHSSRLVNDGVARISRSSAAQSRVSHKRR
jgi:hypothetical protein